MTGPRIEGPVRIRGKEFDRAVLAARRPALVAFTAAWCAPCKWLTPYLESFAASHGEVLLVATLDTDEAPELAQRYRVGSVPTVVFFREGAEVGRSVGVEPNRLHALVDALTSTGPSA